MLQTVFLSWKSDLKLCLCKWSLDQQSDEAISCKSINSLEFLSILDRDLIIFNKDSDSIFNKDSDSRFFDLFENGFL
jgi:catabolite regulation protein CreA